MNDERMFYDLQCYYDMEKYLTKKWGKISEWNEWDTQWRRGSLSGRLDLIGFIIQYVKNGLTVTVDGLEATREEIYQELFITTYGGYKNYIRSDNWKSKADNAKDAAGWCCQLCNEPGDKTTLHAHHRTYERLGFERPGDIIVLCAKCHAKFHGKDK